MDREFGRPAHHEGHRDVVKGIQPAATMVCPLSHPTRVNPSWMGEGADHRRGRLDALHHVAVPFMVGWPAEFAVHSSMPDPVSLALIENSEPSNSGCSPR